MIKMKNWMLGVVVLCLFLILGSPAFAGFANVVSFGDSLSDDGGVSTGFGNGRYTDAGAPIWVELLAAAQGAQGAQLYDFAFGGATTTTWNVGSPQQGYPPLEGTGLESQLLDPFWDISGYINGLGLDKSSTLFTVWAGGNDFLASVYGAAASAGAPGYPDYPIPHPALGDPTFAAQQIGLALDILVSPLFGAQNILVPNLPDISLTIPFLGNEAASWFSGEFNTALEAELAQFRLDNPLVNLYTVDAFALFDGDPALLWAGDGFHPSALGHQMIADAANAAVPIPGAIWLLGSGLIGFAGLKRKQNR
ncbi:MAG: hypothetical protein GY699_07135 [Desulfobacteraceae bacterium]|nr:hypothetical protein [Desulfobacteraceae bacterium]